jgi:hypothetical protein
MKIFLIFIAFSLSLACNRKRASSNTIGSNKSATSTTPDSTIPACIQQKIDSIKKEEKWNPPAQVDEYEYRGRKVYLVSAPCCDFYTTAIDANCNYVCAPSGGITGKGDRKCIDFNEKAKFIRAIWKDERGVK